jgi:hypothetical protein
MEKQKGTTLLIILIIILVVATGGGVIYLEKIGTIDLLKNKTTRVVTSISSSTSSTVNQQTNWQVYDNTKYGYKIKYPANWYFHQTGFNPPPPAGIFLADKPEGTVPEGRTAAPYTSFTVFVDQSMGRTLDNYEEIASLEAQGDKKSQTTVAGQSAVRLESSDTTGFTVSIYVKKDDYIYRLGWQMPPDDTSQKSICEQILQTFTFTS